jgi:hypothetical protein
VESASFVSAMRHPSLASIVCHPPFGVGHSQCHLPSVTSDGLPSGLLVPGMVGNEPAWNTTKSVGRKRVVAAKSGRARTGANSHPSAVIRPNNGSNSAVAYAARHSQSGLSNSTTAWLYRRRDSNPHVQRTADFESAASTVPPLRPSAISSISISCDSPGVVLTDLRKTASREPCTRTCGVRQPRIIR